MPAVASIRIYQRPSGIWYYDIHHPDGSRERESLRTRERSVAEAFKADVERRWRLGLDARDPGSPPLHAVIEDYLESEQARLDGGHDDALAASTLHNRRERLTHPIRMGPLLDLPLGAIGVEQVREWAVSHLTAPMHTAGRRYGGLGPASVRVYLDALAQVFAWANREGLVSGNPVYAYRETLPKGRRKARKRRAEPRVIPSLEAAHRLVEAAREADPGLALVVLHGLDAGLRWGEIRGRRWEHHRWGESSGDRARALLIRESWPTNGRPRETPKTGEVRSVHMSVRLRQALLEERMRQGNPSEGPVFPEAGAMKASTYDNRLYRLCRRAGVLEVGLTDLRHTFASVLLTYGWSLEWISRQMGNSPQTCRTHYARWLREDYVEPPRLPAWAVPQDVMAGEIPGLVMEGGKQ